MARPRGIPGNPKPVDVGAVFGRLTVVERGEKQRGTYKWRCRCECGTVADYWPRLLRAGNTRSCGCLRRELAYERATSPWAANFEKCPRFAVPILAPSSDEKKS